MSRCTDRASFSNQFQFQQARRASVSKPASALDLAKEIDKETDNFAVPFEAKFKPHEMRQLALVAHNHMKPAMKEFIETYSEVLKKFRITGTNTTMRMCKALWGEDNPEVEYGMACTSGPLGGDAQVAALMCLEDLGGLIFLIDPLSAHPHQADIDSLCALEKGSKGMIPSFFETLESPAVEQYKITQESFLKSAISSNKNQAATALSSAVNEDRELTSNVEDADDIIYSRPVQGNRSSTLIPVREFNERKRRDRSRRLMKSLGKSVAVIGRKILDS